MNNTKRLLKLALAGSGLSLGNLKDKTGINTFQLGAIFSGPTGIDQGHLSTIIDVFEAEQVKQSKLVKRAEDEAHGFLISRDSPGVPGITEFLVDRSKSASQKWTSTREELLMVFKDKHKAKEVCSRLKGSPEVWTSSAGMRVISKQKACLVGVNNV
jgi:hypothetical protein